MKLNSNLKEIDLKQFSSRIMMNKVYVKLLFYGKQKDDDKVSKERHS